MSRLEFVEVVFPTQTETLSHSASGAVANFASRVKDSDSEDTPEEERSNVMVGGLSQGTVQEENPAEIEAGE